MISRIQGACFLKTFGGSSNVLPAAYFDSLLSSGIQNIAKSQKLQSETLKLNLWNGRRYNFQKVEFRKRNISLKCTKLLTFQSRKKNLAKVAIQITDYWEQNLLWFKC